MMRDNEGALNRFIKRIKGDDEVSILWGPYHPKAQAYEVLKETPVRIRRGVLLGERLTPDGKIEKGYICSTVVDARHLVPELFTEILISSPDKTQLEEIEIKGKRRTINRVIREVNLVVNRG